MPDGGAPAGQIIRLRLQLRPLGLKNHQKLSRRDCGDLHDFKRREAPEHENEIPLKALKNTPPVLRHETHHLFEKHTTYMKPYKLVLDQFGVTVDIPIGDWTPAKKTLETLRTPSEIFQQTTNNHDDITNKWLWVKKGHLKNPSFVKGQIDQNLWSPLGFSC